MMMSAVRFAVGVLGVAWLLVGVGGAAAQNRVGVTGAVNPQSQFDRSAGLRTIVIGDDVLFRDRIITSEIGLVQVMFVDGSAFTVGPTARVVIDEFVFDPATSTGSLAAEVTSGALRFVGGKIAKRRNAVRFRTPGGTLGVRGGILTIDLEPPCLEDGRCPVAVASFVFGAALTLDLNNGGTRRISKPGYSFVFFGDPRNPSVEIVPTSRLNQSTLQARLSGQIGTTGGSLIIPTNIDVATSGVPALNSERRPIVLLPRPKPVVATSRYAPAPGVPGITETTNIIEAAVLETAQSDAVRSDVQSEESPNPPPPPPPPPPRNSLEDINGFRTGVPPSVPRSIDDPGQVGLIEDVDLTPFGGELVRNDEGQIVSLRIGQDDLPFPAALGVIQLEPFLSLTFDREAKGTVVRGPNDFALYYLQEDIPGADGADDVIYLLTGEPTGQSQIFGTDGENVADLRTYDLTQDFQKEAQGIRSELRLLNPIIAREFGDKLEGAAETKFHIIARPDGFTEVAQTLYAGLLIDGEGDEQVSAINVDSGFVLPEGSGEDGLVVRGRRRGTYRTDATKSASAMTGSTGTLSYDPERDAGIYGGDADNLVYTSGFTGAPADEANAVFLDRDRFDGVLEADEAYSTSTSVASLESKVKVGTLTRSERTLLGFAAGVVESTALSSVNFMSDQVGDFRIAFDPDQSTLGGRILVRDTEDRNSVISAYSFAFGTALPGDDTTRSTFVDDDIYGAVASGLPGEEGSPQTTATTDGGRVIPHTGTSPDTYLVSSTAVPQTALFENAGVTECVCEFLEWGWWGTATSFDDPELGENQVDVVHLGTWAAGDVTPYAQLPTFGTGSYTGNAVGTVIDALPDGSRSRYVAVGDLDVDYNFGERSGNMRVSNFDGRDFGGAITGGLAADGVSNQFTGDLEGSGLRGQANGAFVRGPRSPAQGVVGAFNVRDGRYRATGNFFGEGSVTSGEEARTARSKRGQR